MKRSIYYEVSHNGNLERFWNINKTRNKIKLYLKWREYVICDRIIETKSQYSRINIFKNDIIYKNNELKIRPFYCVDSYRLLQELAKERVAKSIFFSFIM